MIDDCQFLIEARMARNVPTELWCIRLYAFAIGSDALEKADTHFQKDSAAE